LAVKADNELLRLLVLIAIMFQAPALEPRAAVREYGDHVLRLHPNITLGRLRDAWRL
jgi:hypothetical protein